MKKLIVLAAINILAVGCSSNGNVTTYNGQYCYTDQEIVKNNEEMIESETVVKCSDRPKVNHVTRSAGVSYKCRSYSHTIQINGVNRNVKGFLCKFPNGVWEPVNDVYAY